VSCCVSLTADVAVTHTRRSSSLCRQKWRLNSIRKRQIHYPRTYTRCCLPPGLIGGHARRRSLLGLLVRGDVVWVANCPQSSPPPPPRPRLLLLRLVGSRAPPVARVPPSSAGCLVIHHIGAPDGELSTSIRCSYWLLCERLSPIDRKQRSRPLSGPFRCSATSPPGVVVHLCLGRIHIRCRLQPRMPPQRRDLRENPIFSSISNARKSLSLGNSVHTLPGARAPAPI
jgi:hypothetical protein